jgi:polyisoprenoid-binding protein YceI
MAAAAEWRVTLDPAATTIGFSLGATLHTVDGRVSLSSGSLRLDPETGAIAGEIVVEAASADTGNDSRDEDMHAKVLRSRAHPTIVLRPERIEGKIAPHGTSTAVLTGQIELVGQSHGISFPIELMIEGATLSASGTFTVPYVEWGLEDPSKFLLRVAKEVHVIVKAEGSFAVAEPSH